MEIILKLQGDHPQVFLPMAVYDGRKNLFAPQALSFGDAVQVRTPEHRAFLSVNSFVLV